MLTCAISMTHHIPNRYGDDVPDSIVAEAADGLLEQFDANGDGKISFEEMLAIWGYSYLCICAWGVFKLWW